MSGAFLELTRCEPGTKQICRKGAEAGFDVLITCDFNVDAYAGGNLEVLKMRRNSDLQIAADLDHAGSDDPFIIFGKPDIAETAEQDRLAVEVRGVDVFESSSSESCSENIDCKTCFVGHHGTCTSLQFSLRNKSDPTAWSTLDSDFNQAFGLLVSSLAVHVLRHLDEEVMEVLKVPSCLPEIPP